MFRTKSLICSNAASGGLMTTVNPASTSLSSESVTTQAISMSASAPKSRPVISQSIHTSGSATGMADTLLLVSPFYVRNA